MGRQLLAGQRGGRGARARRRVRRVARVIVRPARLDPADCSCQRARQRACEKRGHLQGWRSGLSAEDSPRHTQQHSPSAWGCGVAQGEVGGERGARGRRRSGRGGRGPSDAPRQRRPRSPAPHSSSCTPHPSVLSNATSRGPAGRAPRRRPSQSASACRAPTAFLAQAVTGILVGLRGGATGARGVWCGRGREFARRRSVRAFHASTSSASTHTPARARPSSQYPHHEHNTRSNLSTPHTTNTCHVASAPCTALRPARAQPAFVSRARARLSSRSGPPALPPPRWPVKGPCAASAPPNTSLVASCLACWAVKGPTAGLTGARPAVLRLRPCVPLAPCRHECRLLPVAYGCGLPGCFSSYKPTRVRRRQLAPAWAGVLTLIM
jgi:hypothetical protein